MLHGSRCNKVQYEEDIVHAITMFNINHKWDFITILSSLYDVYFIECMKITAW